jgi:Tol biopolymer transport system component
MIAWSSPAGVTVERADGRAKRVLVPAVAGCKTFCASLMSFDWSPDSKQLLVGGAGKQTNLLVSVSVGTGRTKMVAAVRKNVIYGVVGWSPDGSSIAYARQGAQSYSQLMVANADGTAARSLFDFREMHDSPSAAWSPDSRSIAFIDEGRDPHDPPFAVVDVATSAVQPITGLGLNPYLEPPVWSPDSKRLAVAQYKRPAVTLAATGADVHSLGATGTQVIWTRDGDIIVVNGIAHGSVYQSPDGSIPASPIFRLPTKITDITLDSS